MGCGCKGSNPPVEVPASGSTQTTNSFVNNVKDNIIYYSMLPIGIVIAIPFILKISFDAIFRGKNVVNITDMIQPLLSNKKKSLVSKSQ